MNCFCMALTDWEFAVATTGNKCMQPYPHSTLCEYYAVYCTLECQTDFKVNFLEGSEVGKQKAFQKLFLVMAYFLLCNFDNSKLHGACLQAILDLFLCAHVAASGAFNLGCSYVGADAEVNRSIVCHVILIITIFTSCSVAQFVSVVQSGKPLGLCL